MNVKNNFDPNEMREEKFYGNLMRRIEHTNKDNVPIHSLIAEQGRPLSFTNKWWFSDN